MRKQFFISGLGANERAFEKLDDFGTQKIMIKWIVNKKDESLQDYAIRIIEKYTITKSDLIIGLSFGGLIAQQIAHLLGIKEVILISSFRTKHDLNKIFKMGLKLKLYKLMPTFNAPFLSFIIADYLNSGSNKSKPVLKDMLATTNMNLVKWSINKIYEQNEIIDKSIRLINLIGNNDKIINLWENESTYIINNGSHFMVHEQANEISYFIKKSIN